MAEGSAGFDAALGIHHISPSRGIDAIHDAPPEVRDWLKSIGEDAETFAKRHFGTRLFAHHFRPDPLGDFVGHHPDQGPPPSFRPHVIVQDPDLHGKRHILVGEHDLGSGLITNSGVLMMINDFAWAAGSSQKQFNQHLLGTGTTAAALTDVYVQTPILAASLTGSTNGYMAATQSSVIPTTAVPHPIYQTVATFTANASLAVTEWGLCMAAVLPVNRTSAGAAPTNNTFTDTGATFVTAGNGVQGYTIEAVASTPINTPTSTNFGIVLTNTATVLTLLGPSASTAWITLAAATGANPAATITYSLFPSMLDRKVFSALNLVAADTLSMTHQLQYTSGG